MWLWRAETGLWERDPATPMNFRGNLLGIAFDPANPARGYAVGERGPERVLLRYGKTWTQEAGAPAQVAGRDLHLGRVRRLGGDRRLPHAAPTRSTNHYIGGVLVNEGSGWQIDQEAERRSGGKVPWAVAGLPDGGAAFLTGGGEGGQRVYERKRPARRGRRRRPLPGRRRARSRSSAKAARCARSLGGGVGQRSEELNRRPGFPPNDRPSAA